MKTKVKIFVSFYHPSKISAEALEDLGGQKYIDNLNKDGEERMAKAKSLNLKGTKTSEGEFEFTGEMNGNYEQVFETVNKMFDGKGFCVANPKYNA